MADWHWSLSLDIASVKAMVWFASVGRDAEVTREVHLFFFDRYSRLADYHREHGRIAKAKRFEGKAEEHRVEGPGDPPYAAAMAMPRPRRFVYTNAVGNRRTPSPDDVA